VSVSPASGSSETAPGNYNFASHGATLILAIRQGCEFCERSMGFYAALARADDRIQSKVHLLACLPDKPTVAAGLLRSNNVPVDYRAGWRQCCKNPCIGSCSCSIKNCVV
jgi:hypothetical protein